MDRLFDHIAIYDFWGIFGAGAVIGVSAAFLLCNNWMYALSNEQDMQIFTIFIAVVTFYTIGLILHCIASLIIEAPLLGLDPYKVTDRKNDKAIYKYVWKKRYILENPLIRVETLQKGFIKCYTYLKLNDLTKRIDKYHSIYGMARSLFVGYTLIGLLIISDSIFNGFNFINFKSLFICVILAILFFIRAKKYFYRWTELIFIKYQFETKPNENKEEDEN